MIQKSYDTTPTLYLIPTPIGNLDDITLRSIKMLKQVDILFTEDTRETIKLLNHLNIKNKMITNHNYNEEKNQNKVIQYLKNGYNIGLVSDRGTPVISDPGYKIAKTVINNNFNVVGLPGATALIPALITSGLEPYPFLFYGFLNNKGSKRKKELHELKKLKYTIIIYESPHRLDKTLTNILEIMGNRNISISREITKKHEEVFRGTTLEAINKYNKVKGELVIVIEKNKDTEEIDDTIILKCVQKYIDKGYSPSESIKKVSYDKNINRNKVYNLYHNIN